MSGAQGQANPLPSELEWPADPMFSNVGAELFKLRNARDAIIGVASRFALNDPEFGEQIEWVLHLPARGSIFVGMSPQPVDRNRVGDLSAGTREFGSILGQLSERWVADTSGSSGELTGRIELSMSSVSKEQHVPDLEDAE